jgi:hypothetical protein
MNSTAAARKQQLVVVAAAAAACWLQAMSLAHWEVVVTATAASSTSVRPRRLMLLQELRLT